MNNGQYFIRIHVMFQWVFAFYRVWLCRVSLTICLMENNIYMINQMHTLIEPGKEYLFNVKAKRSWVALYSTEVSIIQPQYWFSGKGHNGKEKKKGRIIFLFKHFLCNKNSFYCKQSINDMKQDESFLQRKAQK